MVHYSIGRTAVQCSAVQCSEVQCSAVQADTLTVHPHSGRDGHWHLRYSHQKTHSKDGGLKATPKMARTKFGTKHTKYLAAEYLDGK